MIKYQLTSVYLIKIELCHTDFYSKQHFFLAVPPTIHKREPVYDINGTLGKPIPINIDIYCFPSSIVSWSHTAGGKLGTWTTTPHLSISSHFRQTFRLESTVLPTKRDHFGLYSVIVRNSAGSLELIIRLHLNGMYMLQPRQV